MTIRVYGVDHRSSSLSYRESLLKDAGRFMGRGHVLFATCNRVESYGFGIDPLFDHGYAYDGENGVFKHLVALACGLRSQLIGERQIMDQLDGFSRSAGECFKHLIGSALQEARQIRRAFGLDTDKTIADAVYNHVRGRGLLGGRTVVVGAGEVARLVGERFCRDSELCFVSGRNKYRARQLAARYNGEAFDRKNISRALFGAKVVICAAHSPHYVVTSGHMAAGRAVYDLALPRNVEPGLNAVDLDGLAGEIEALNGAVKERAARAVKEIEER